MNTQSQPNKLTNSTHAPSDSLPRVTRPRRNTPNRFRSSMSPSSPFIAKHDDNQVLPPFNLDNPSSAHRHTQLASQFIGDQDKQSNSPRRPDNKVEFRRVDSPQKIVIHATPAEVPALQLPNLEMMANKHILRVQNQVLSERNKSGASSSVARSLSSIKDEDDDDRIGDAAERKKLKILRLIANIRKINLDALEDGLIMDLALEIIKKPAPQRNVHEAKVLAKSVSTVEFFKRYDEETIDRCLRNMYYVKMKGEEMVFEAGTVGTTFWVILKGSVSVLVNLDKVVGTNELGENITRKVLTEVKVMKSGSSFGELALINSMPRAASIKCKEECEFAVLDKNPFKMILKEKEKKNIFANIDLLVGIPVFKALPYHAVHWLYYNSKMKKCIKGQVIYDEGEACDSFYIIKSGEFKITKTVEIENENINGTAEAFEKMKRRPVIKKTVEVAILGQHETFGEEELMSAGCTERYFKVACSSLDAEIYEFTRDQLDKKVFVFLATKDSIKKSSERKEKYYNSRVKAVLETRNDRSPVPTITVELSPVVKRVLDAKQSSIIFDEVTDFRADNKKIKDLRELLGQPTTQRAITFLSQNSNPQPSMASGRASAMTSLKQRPRLTHMSSVTLANLSEEKTLSKSGVKGHIVTREVLSILPDPPKTTTSLMQLNLDRVNCKPKRRNQIEASMSRMTERRKQLPKRGLEDNYSSVRTHEDAKRRSRDALEPDTASTYYKTNDVPSLRINTSSERRFPKFGVSTLEDITRSREEESSSRSFRTPGGKISIRDIVKNHNERKHSDDEFKCDVSPIKVNSGIGQSPGIASTLYNETIVNTMWELNQKAFDGKSSRLSMLSSRGNLETPSVLDIKLKKTMQRHSLISGGGQKISGTIFSFMSPEVINSAVRIPMSVRVNKNKLRSDGGSSVRRKLTDEGSARIDGAAIQNYINVIDADL